MKKIRIAKKNEKIPVAKILNKLQKITKVKI